MNTRTQIKRCDYSAARKTAWNSQSAININYQTQIKTENKIIRKNEIKSRAARLEK